jgi:hypothetical protein
MRRVLVLLATVATVMAAAPAAYAADATVSGYVTDAAGAPLADVCAEVVANAHNGTAVASVRTAADGGYTASAPAGSYYVRFRDCGNRDLVTRYWPNAVHRYNATLVALADGQQRTGVNGTMPRGGALSGTVTNTAGEPVQNVHVDLRPVSDQSHPLPIDVSVRTDAQGRWVARGLPVAKYRVTFSDPPNYASILYGNTPDAALSPDVEVTVATEQTGVNAVMPRAGRITGVVRDDQGNPFPKQCVLATGGTAQGSLGNGAMTGDDGAYVLEHLAPGAYRVEFSDCSGVSAPTWYAGATTRAKATPVTVTENGETTGIDGALTPGFTVTGTVRDREGNPLPGIGVIVYDAVTGSFTGRQAWTDEEGHYQLVGLRGTLYKLEFGGCCQQPDIVTRWWPNSQTQAGALPVSLVAGVSLTGIDMVLPRGGRLSGTVRDEAGEPVAGVCAYATNVVSDRGNSARTGADGRYQIRALDLGAYRVWFRSCNGANIAPAHYGGTDARSSAELVTVALEEETPGIDHVVRPGGTITGRVTDVNGVPISQVCVWPESPSAGLTADSANTDDDGRYTLTGLAPHSDYKVQFRDCFVRPGRYVPTFNGGTDDGEAAPTMNVTRGATLTADATMVRGGSASGTVFDQFGLPLYGVCVNVIRTDYKAAGSWHTDQSGTFSVGGLKAGTYKAYFSDCGAGIVSSVWAPGVLLESQARTFQVRAGEDTPDIDATVTVITTPKAPVDVTVDPGDGLAKVAWQPPGDTGNSPLTGFEVRKPDGTVVARTGPSAKSATVPGLTNGTTYEFTVNAVNVKGPGDSSEPVSVLPRPVPKLAATFPSRVVSGSYASVKGKLTKASGAALPGMRVGLYGRRQGSTAAMVRLTGATTSSTGTYSMLLRPTHPMEYAVRFPGTATLSPVAVGRAVAVAPRVTRTASGRAVTATVSPAAGGGTARLQVWRSTGWANVVSAALPSTGRVTLRAPGPGRWRVTVTRSGWALGVSSSVTLA